jgi:hypothetical protein
LLKGEGRAVASSLGVAEAELCSYNTLNGLNYLALLRSASLIVTPNSYNEGTLFSVIPSNGNGDFTVTRATKARRTNSSGLIESVANNVPRLDYSLGSCPNLLLEPQRTNLALQSQNFSDGSWTALGSTKVSTNNTDPSGNLTALNLTWPSGGSKYFYRVYAGLTIGTTYTITFYVKSTNSSKFRIYTESLGIFSSDFTSTSSYQRYQFTFTATIATGTFGFISATDNSAADLIIAFAQLEAGAYATSYIPTTSASVTRNADVIERNNIYTNGLITASGGTWFVELRNNVALTRDASTSGLFLDTSSSGLINGFSLRLGGGNARLFIIKIIAGVSTPLHLTTTDTTKIAIKWNGTTADVFANGVKVVSATAFTITNMQFISGSGSDVPKVINQMALFPTPLTDTQCTLITS